MRKMTFKIPTCSNCNKKVMYDTEGDLIHSHLQDSGIDPRMCEPSNPDSKIAIQTGE